jgi:hypothetical protein
MSYFRINIPVAPALTLALQPILRRHILFARA